MMLQATLTAYAWRTPLGADIDTAMRRLYAGERAARIDPELASYPCKLGARIPNAPRRSRHERFLSRLGLLAVEAGREAAEKIACENLGIFTAVSGLQAQWHELMPALAELGRGSPWHACRRLHPFWLLKYLSNNVHGLLSEDLNARAEGACFGGATAAVHAVRAAAAALAEGAIDAALVVAYDSLLEPERLIDAAARGLCTTGEGLPPYHPQAAGTVPGEAAVAVVLQRPRAGSVLVSAVGACDGTHDEPDASLLEPLLRSLAVNGPVVVDGAARASHFDRDERALLARLWGSHVALTASASAMGDTGAAQPLLQLVAATEMLRRGLVAPIAGVDRSALPTRAGMAVALAVGAPGLAGALHVVMPPTPGV